LKENLASSTNPDDFLRTRVQAILLGDYLSIIGVPGEMFSRFGRMIKDAVRTRFCIVQELVNNDIVSDDEMAYVPTREALLARIQNTERRLRGRHRVSEPERRVHDRRSGGQARERLLESRGAKK